jgi:hypothetical protein
MHDERYLDMVNKVGTGQVLSEDAWLSHFDHQNAGASDGTPIGERAPDFAVCDQSGATQSLGSLSRDNGLLLVFARSAHW